MNEQAKILVVDDDPYGRKALGSMLEHDGYDVTLAASGREAIDLATAAPPDLILLDVMMPQMNGFDVCRTLRAHPILVEVPIIFLTALDDYHARQNGLEAGADDFISKPYDRIELRTRVHTITRLNRYRRLLQERLQRQQAEAEIVQRNHEIALLQESNRVRQQLVSNVSHELRTPLAVLTLLLSNLEKAGSNSPQQQARIIKECRQQCNHLNTLVEQVLDIARLDALPSRGKEAPVDLAVLLNDEIERQRPLLERKQQVHTIETEANAIVSGEKELFRRVVANLVNNAIKYSGEHSSINCYVRPHSGLQAQVDWPEAGILPEGHWVMLQVRDQGIGIAAEEKQRIFERFYRIQQQTQVAGVGLGLAIVAEIVKTYGGWIEVSSTLGKGTTFTVYFPQVAIGETV